MMDFVYGIIDENGKVVNIIASDNADSVVPLKLLIPDAADVVLSTEETGYPCIGGDILDGVFRYPSPYPSWIWNGTEWVAPVEYPQDGLLYSWDEEISDWSLFTPPE